MATRVAQPVKSKMHRCLQDEAEAITGEADPDVAAASILRRPQTRTSWCAVKLGPRGALLQIRDGQRLTTLRHPGFRACFAAPSKSLPTQQENHACCLGGCRRHSGLRRQLCCRFILSMILFAAIHNLPRKRNFPGLVLGLVRGYAPEATLSLSNAMGAATAGGLGAGRSVGTAARVRAILESSLQAGCKDMLGALL